MLLFLSSCFFFFEKKLKIVIFHSYHSSQGIATLSTATAIDDSANMSTTNDDDLIRIDYKNINTQDGIVISYFCLFVCWDFKTTSKRFDRRVARRKVAKYRYKSCFVVVEKFLNCWLFLILVLHNGEQTILSSTRKRNTLFVATPDT